ncbi:MAG: hypothetical protein VX916_06605 [Planctomycetota bacterium]|nr:hypothetical protein [Planctomycetota bacterium]
MMLSHSRNFLIACCLVVCACNVATKFDEARAVWVTRDFKDIGYSSLFGVVSTTINSEGFRGGVTDPGRGRLESGWRYGDSQRKIRGPSRRKVIVEIDLLTSRSHRVRLRVKEEVLRKQGLLATQVRENEEWEIYEDNLEEAEFLMAKLKALIPSSAASVQDEGDDDDS